VTDRQTVDELMRAVARRDEQCRHADTFDEPRRSLERYAADETLRTRFEEAVATIRGLSV
jgi:hypothetical protein